MDSKFTFTVNGQSRTVSTNPQRPLLDVLREDLQLTGTKYGCGEGQCRACTVLINGKAVASCMTPVAEADKQTIVTIEGLAAKSSHPVQQAWLELDVPQCGYCQSGQIMAAAALLKKNPNPSDKDIDEAMTNICRCGTYQRIRAGVHAAAKKLASAAPANRKAKA